LQRELLKQKIWVSGLRETNWKHFEAFSFFRKRQFEVFLGASGRWEERGQLMGAAAFTVGIKPR
jgi:hypothetical protein